MAPYRIYPEGRAWRWVLVDEDGREGEGGRARDRREAAALVIRALVRSQAGVGEGRILWRTGQGRGASTDPRAARSAARPDRPDQAALAA